MTISTLVMSVSTIACYVSAMTISAFAISAMAISAITMSVAFTISTITMPVAFAISVMVIASIAVAIQIRVVANRCVIWSKFMKVIEGSNDMRSIKSMGKFYFRRTRFVEHLNGDVFLPTFMQFFVQGIVQPFGLMDTLSFEFSFFLASNIAYFLHNELLKTRYF